MRRCCSPRFTPGTLSQPTGLPACQPRGPRRNCWRNATSSALSQITVDTTTVLIMILHMQSSNNRSSPPGGEARPEPPDGPEPSSQAMVLGRALQWAWLRLTTVHRGRSRAAERAVRALFARAATERWALLAKRPALWRPEVVSRLLQEAREQAETGGPGVEELARLAIHLAERLRPSQLAPSLLRDHLAEAWGVLAEELIAQRDLDAADLALSHAELFSMTGSGDPLLAGEVALTRGFEAWARGDLKAAQGDMEEALRLVQDAKSTFEEARVCLWLSLVHGALGDARATRQAFTAACRLVDQTAAGLAFEQARRQRDRLGLKEAQPKPPRPMDPLNPDGG